MSEISDPTLAAGRAPHTRLAMLDGWRAISILTVMAAHMLPLGPKSWSLNTPVAALGMSIFFTLSGFLVTSILLRNQDVLGFVIKRLARIVPLAWAVLIVVLAVADASTAEWRANLLFYANLPPFYLQHSGHFWSLGVEMQFYAAIGLTIAVFGVRGLWIVPLASLTITLTRIINHEPLTIVTWFRADEILAGGPLALLLHAEKSRVRGYLSRLPFTVLAVMFLFSAGAASYLIPLNYLRPYLAASLVGITIVRPIALISPLLTTRFSRYVATISYALYIFHPYSMSVAGVG